MHARAQKLNLETVGESVLTNYQEPAGRILEKAYGTHTETRATIYVHGPNLGSEY